MELSKDEIIRMAREAGLLAEDEAWVSPYQEAMERFAALVAAHERELCAKVCDEMYDLHEEDWDYCVGLVDCAAAIRSRCSHEASNN